MIGSNILTTIQRRTRVGQASHSHRTRPGQNKKKKGQRAGFPASLAPCTVPPPPGSAADPFVPPPEPSSPASPPPGNQTWQRPRRLRWASGHLRPETRNSAATVPIELKNLPEFAGGHVPLHYIATQLRILARRPLTLPP